MHSVESGVLPWREDEDKARFTGRLERDPEFYERDGNPRCSLLIACIRTRLSAGQLVKKTIHIEVRASGTLAEHACRHLRKGVQIRVTGEHDCYPIPSPAGGKRMLLQVAAHEIEIEQAQPARQSVDGSESKRP